MGLTSSLYIGSSALNASQLAIQVTGNNLANAATPGYSRQIARLTPMRGDAQTLGLSVGTGVRVAAVRRQVDEALQARVWSGLSGESLASQQLTVLSQLESTLNELTGQDFSSELRAFFNSWSERANLSQSSAVVVERGVRLASFVQRLRADMTGQREQIDRQLAVEVERADALLTEIAGLNGAIAEAESAGGAVANELRDRRDHLITELSGFLDVSVVEQASGVVDVLVGSTPIVLGARVRGIELKRQTVNGEPRVAVALKEDGQELAVSEGRIGGMLRSRAGDISDTIAQLDRVASQLIFQVNRIHSMGANAHGLTATTGTLALATADRNVALNDPQNSTASLPFRATHGGFLVRVRQAATNSTEEVFIKVDLDGKTASGAPGFGDDTSAESIRASIDAIDGVRASFTADGRLSISAETGFEFSFGNDTSGALAVLGVNSFFTGRDASDMGVRSDLSANPSRLMTGRIVNGALVENATALQIAGLEEAALPALGGRSLGQTWLDSVQRVGVATQSAQTRADAATLVREGLEAQQQAVSGVSIDEESINLITFQRQYQGAARFVSVVDELTQVLISLV